MILRLVIISFLCSLVSSDSAVTASSPPSPSCEEPVIGRTLFLSPEKTADSIKCTGLELSLRWSDGVINTTAELKCDQSSRIWKTDNNKEINNGTLMAVFCESATPEQVEEENRWRMMKREKRAKPEEKEAESGWVNAGMIVVEVLFVIAISILIARMLLNVTQEKQKENLGAWSKHWEVSKYDVDPWNWHMVLNFVHHWHRRTIEEKVKFIEKGYSELSFKSSITQMLYIFEYMLMAESSCFVWRPMLSFLLRMKRLASPSTCELKLIHKFDSYLAFKGQQLLDEFGYMEGDATESDTCSTVPSKTMSMSDLDEMGDEDDYSLSTDDTLDDLSADDTEEKSKKSKKDEKKTESSSRKKGKKGKGKRGAAGADEKRGGEVRKDGATPVVVKMDEGKAVKFSETKSEVPGMKTETKSENQGDDHRMKKNTGRDDPDGYCRFVGAWLMMMGADGQDITPAMEMRELYNGAFFDLTGPIIGPLGSIEIRKATGNGDYERLFDRVTSGPDLDSDKEWGSVWEHCLYALASITDEQISSQVQKYMLEEQKIHPRHVVAWFRGAIDRGSGHALPFIFRDFKLLTRKVKMHTPEFYEMFKIYCFQDHTPYAWDTVERLVLKNLALTKRLNVPEYRRRAQHFTAHFMWQGYQELDHFLRDPQRRADIKESEYVNLDDEPN